MTQSEKPRLDLLGMSITILALLILVAHATSWALSLEWLGRLLRLSKEFCSRPPHLAVADVLIWVTGALLFVRLIVERDWKTLRLLSLPGLLLAALAVASVFNAVNRFTAVAKAVEFAEYFVLLYLVFASVMATKERLLTALNLWMLVGAAIVVWGLVHYLTDRKLRPDVDVSGPFADRNVYGGYLAMILPVAFGLAIWPARWTAIGYGGILVGVGLSTMLAGGPLLGALAGIAVILAIRWHWGFALFAAGVVGLVIWGTPQLDRPDHMKTLRDSVGFFDEGDASAGATPNVRYLEWQAAMKPLTPGFHRDFGIPESRHVRQMMFGVGVGNYQINVDQYYGALPKPNRNTTEPHTENLYLVLAVEAGIPAALVFLWLIVAHLRRAAKGYLATGDKMMKGLLLGCIGGMASLVVTNLFTNTLVHGTGPATVFLLALAAAAATLAEREPSATK